MEWTKIGTKTNFWAVAVMWLLIFVIHSISTMIGGPTMWTYALFTGAVIVIFMQNYLLFKMGGK